GPLVEGDRPDRLRWRPRGDQPRRPGDERGGLAAPCRGDAQRRSGWRGGGSTLVRRQPGESLGDGRVDLHRGSLAGGVRLTLIRALGPSRPSPPLPNRNVVVHPGTSRRELTFRTVFAGSHLRSRGVIVCAPGSLCPVRKGRGGR